jgi:peptide/nickel transport system substrate-binding protein
MIQRGPTLGGKNFDPGAMSKFQYMGYLQYLYEQDWTVDPDVWPFKTEFGDPEYFSGLLAESWEQTDPLTITLRVREGVSWQDKAPVNGREFTAEDIQYNYDRALGTGNGYTEPNPMMSGMLANLERVVATDSGTVEFRFKTQNAFNIYIAMDVGFGSLLMAPPEWIEQGIFDDWTNVIGTGPWVMTNLVTDGSVTFSKDPNYWGYDGRYPDNQIPYVDTYKVLMIMDVATSLAAMRTGKIDIFGGGGGSATWQEAESLANTHPDIDTYWSPNPGLTLDYRCDTEPFNDIRVRTALQMAVDLETIAATHYGGTVDGNPAGLATPYYNGWAIAYEDWSDELKAEYAYDPEGARSLLAEAGYPDGFDTNIYACSTDDLQFLQIIKAYLSDIGVEMEIKTFTDFPSLMTFVMAGKHDQMVLSNNCGMGMRPDMFITRRYSTNNENLTHNNDSHYDELVDQFQTATTIADAKQIYNQAELYALEQHWSINIFPYVVPVFVQPYIKGINKEGNWDADKTWIDQGLKKSMGR